MGLGLLKSDNAACPARPGLHGAGIEDSRRGMFVLLTRVSRDSAARRCKSHRYVAITRIVAGNISNCGDESTP